MPLATYQADAARTLNASLTEDQRLLDASAGLAEEAGEILAHVRRHLMQGRALDREGLAIEIGDALWCVSALATTLGLTLDAIADRNIEKLKQRHPEGLGRSS